MFFFAQHDRGPFFYFNDLALLRVDDPMPEQYIIQMAENGDSFVGQNCTIAGWGTSSEFIAPTFIFFPDVYLMENLNDAFKLF